MAGFTFKQRLVIWLILIIETIVNSKIFILPLNLLSRLFYWKVFSFKTAYCKNLKSKKIHVAFIPDGNRRWFKENFPEKQTLISVKEDSGDSCSLNTSDISLEPSNNSMDVLNGISDISSCSSKSCLGVDENFYNESIFAKDSKNKSSLLPDMSADSIDVRRRIKSSFISNSISTIKRPSDATHNESGLNIHPSNKTFDCILTSKETPKIFTSSSEIVSSLENERFKYGFDKLKEIIKYALYTGIEEVSFYCLSIKNLNRKKSDIEPIMDMIRKKSLDDMNIQCKFNVYGRLDLLESDVKQALLDLVEKTKDNKGFVLNLFVAYSSTDEECRGIEFDRKVDLLIRTGGEKRLSDFMVRQVANGTSVDFLSPKWPEISLLHISLTIFKYQLEQKYLIK